jgi:ribonuclease PH
MTFQRIDGRSPDQLRPYCFERNFIKTAEGSVLVSCGDTKVIVTAKIDPSLPPHLRNLPQKQGWITAEYAMLPGSSHDRVGRERNKAHSRSLEIQRLIGRSLRAMVDLEKMPPVSINIDADVIQADGGTRTASITGAYVAVYDCLRHMQLNGVQLKDEFIKPFADGLPIVNQVAAISVGIVDGLPLLDLNYHEDSQAEADANFILTSSGKIIEIQASAEESSFDEAAFHQMFILAKKAIKELTGLQNQSLGVAITNS